MLVPYALKPEMYSNPCAVLFNNCSEHISSAIKSKDIVDRIVHLVIGILEAIPIIGQIGSFCEKIIFELNKQTIIEYHRVLDQQEKIAKLVESTYKDAFDKKTFSLNSQDPRYIAQQLDLKKIYGQIKRVESRAYTADIKRKIKELATCPELIEARAALKKGIAPQLMSDGISGSYLLIGRLGEKCGIFKPSAQEPGTVGNPKGFSAICQQGLFGVVPGEGYLRERVAYLLDKNNRFAEIPLTKITKFKSKYFPLQSRIHSKELVGSFQKWIADAHPAYDDYQILPRWISSAHGDQIPVDQIHKVAVFDIRTLNCDRHLKNFLVDAGLQNTYPIDHGFICPGNAESLRFDWINFPQAKDPFSKKTLTYIEQLDPEADAALIKKHIPTVSTDTIKRLKISIRLLQIAAKKCLTAYQIADLYMRRKHEGVCKILNNFFPIPAATPSYFETHIWGVIKSTPNLNLETFLVGEVDKYMALTSSRL
jgi:hypothetical protein